MRSDAFRLAVEQHDASLLVDVLAPDVVFRSPAVFKPYEGRDAVLAVLAAADAVFEGFHYTDQLEDGDVAVLAFGARVGDRALEGIDLLRFDDDRRVAELAVYVRPLSGLTALAEAIGRRLGVG
jgi:hypothetical protein